MIVVGNRRIKQLTRTQLVAQIRSNGRLILLIGCVVCIFHSQRLERMLQANRHMQDEYRQKDIPTPFNEGNAVPPPPQVVQDAAKSAKSTVTSVVQKESSEVLLRVTLRAKEAEIKRTQINQESSSLSNETDGQFNPVIEEQIRQIVRHVASCQGKEVYLRMIFSAADHKFDVGANFRDLCSKLPLEEDVHNRYGSKPIILGMERCEAYRQFLLPKYNDGKQIEPMPRIAGLYHTGSNALNRLLVHNVKEMRHLYERWSAYDVPWGKHIPATMRATNRASYNNTENPYHVLPIVVVRDPFYWMNSMCKHWYDAKWEKPPDRRCPSIIKDESSMTPYKVHVLQDQAHYEVISTYKSLPDMWSEWNRQYLDADFARLMIRFEDLLYHPREVMDSIRTCIGLPTKKNHTFVLHHIGSPKDHGEPTGFVESLTKHITDEGKYHGLNKVDRQYTNHVALDSDLMRLFGYKYASMNVTSMDLSTPYAGWLLRPEGWRDVLEKSQMSPENKAAFIQQNE